MYKILYCDCPNLLFTIKDMIILKILLIASYLGLIHIPAAILIGAQGKNIFRLFSYSSLYLLLWSVLFSAVLYASFPNSYCYLELPLPPLTSLEHVKILAQSTYPLVWTSLLWWQAPLVYLGAVIIFFRKSKQKRSQNK